MVLSLEDIKDETTAIQALAEAIYRLGLIDYDGFGSIKRRAELEKEIVFYQKLKEICFHHVVNMDGFDNLIKEKYPGLYKSIIEE